jgi:hypothetical protein
MACETGLIDRVCWDAPPNAQGRSTNESIPLAHRTLRHRQHVTCWWLDNGVGRSRLVQSKFRQVMTWSRVRKYLTTGSCERWLALQGRADAAERHCSLKICIAEDGVGWSNVGVGPAAKVSRQQLLVVWVRPERYATG